MFITYATRSFAIHLAVTGTIAVGICKSLDLMMDQATVAPIRQSWAEVTYMRFAAPGEQITSSTSII